jgi:hypothetical protein
MFVIRVESSTCLSWADDYIEPDKWNYLLCEHMPSRQHTELV